MRPRQWTKNLIVFAPALFGGVLFEAGTAVRVAFAFALACMLSGAVYLFNDLRDAGADRAYAKTRVRPLASGRIKPRQAAVAAAILTAVALGGALALGGRFAALLGAYLLLQAAYTLWLKHVVVLDVLAIAGGFVLRAVAGAEAAGVADSPWLLACAALLVVFLALAKRRQESADLGEGASTHRRVLGVYTRPILDVLIGVSVCATIAGYLVYSAYSAVARIHPLMVLTAPFVVYGLFRYLTLVYAEGSAKTADEVLLTDVRMLADVALWVGAVVVIVYVV